MADVEVTIVARWQQDREPEEEEVRGLVEGLWLGTLLTFEVEEV